MLQPAQSRDLSRWLAFVATIFVLVVATFAAYVWAEKRVDRTQALRLESLLLADELRHSSEGLTKMARSYVVTGNPVFKQHYADILDIRDGRKPRSEPHNDYWDLVVYGEKLPPVAAGRSAPLLDLVRQVAPGEEETALLTTAKLNSDALAKLELEAMRLYDSGPDAAARERAKELLYDQAYDRAKLAILRPISRFNAAMDARTAAAVDQALSLATLFRLVFIGAGLFWLALLVSSYRSLRTLLGAAPGELQAQIARLGQGDFAPPAAGRPPGEQSVMAWLNETRRRLHELTAARQEAESQVALRSDALAKSEARLRAIVEVSPVPKALIDPDGRISYFNPAFIRCFGYTLEDVPTVEEWWPKAYPDPTYRAWVIATWRERLARARRDRTPFEPMEVNVRCKDGSVRTVIGEGAPFEEAGLAHRNLVVFHDVTELTRANAEVKRQKEYLQTIFLAEPECVKVVARDGRLEDMNPAGLKMLEVDTLAEAQERGLLAFVDADHRARFAELHQAVCGGASGTLEFAITGAKGARRWLETHATPLHDEHGAIRGLLGVTRDVTEQKASEEAIRHLAFYDRLTSLPNRRLLEDRLQQAIARARRERRRMALLFIDLDRLKQVNDALGHEAGDWLLQQVAERMQQGLRTSDTAARIGGDEFVVLLPDADGVEDATTAAERIRAALEKPFARPDGKVLEISSSIGVVLFPDHAESPRDLLRFSDEAMYRAKKGGRNAVHVFSPADASAEGEGTSLIRLHWTPAYACGEPSLDLEHQDLFARANALLELATARAAKPAAFDEAFEGLLAHAQAHFQHEEAILRAHGYEGLREHAVRHAELLSQAVELREQARGPGVPISRLVDFLASELVIGHLLGEDRRFLGLFARASADARHGS